MISQDQAHLFNLIVIHARLNVPAFDAAIPGDFFARATVRADTDAVFSGVRGLIGSMDGVQIAVSLPVEEGDVEASELPTLDRFYLVMRHAELGADVIHVARDGAGDPAELAFDDGLPAYRALIQA